MSVSQPEDDQRTFLIVGGGKEGKRGGREGREKNERSEEGTKSGKGKGTGEELVAVLARVERMLELVTVRVCNSHIFLHHIFENTAVRRQAFADSVHIVDAYKYFEWLHVKYLPTIFIADCQYHSAIWGL